MILDAENATSTFGDMNADVVIIGARTVDFRQARTLTKKSRQVLLEEAVGFIVDSLARPSLWR